ncbi:MAG: amidohydrolase family protein [Bacteroidia bacterium]|nr:amidohydrolase family protein [Bacteroidia bacterium]
MSRQYSFFYSPEIFDGKNFIRSNNLALCFSKSIFHEFVPVSNLMPGTYYHTQNILMPGFVNAHHHLELSMMKEKPPKISGINDFFVRVISQRKKFSDVEIISYAQQEAENLKTYGIALCGDISNTGITASVKKNSITAFHTFVEVLAYDIHTISNAIEKAFSLYNDFVHNNNTASLSPHAPFTVHPDAFRRICDTSSSGATCMHYMESEGEKKWYEGDKSSIKKLFELSGVVFYDDDHFVKFYHPKAFLNKKLDKRFLLIHGTHLDPSDWKSGSHFLLCFCPRSNLYIENKLPSEDLVRCVSDIFCLGTDSLASSPDGNVLNEANLMLENYSFLTEQQVLKSITFNGAFALGRENEFGSFIKGKSPGLNEIQIQKRQLKLIKRLL